MAHSQEDKNGFSVDAYSPMEMACKAESIGSKKANLDFLSTFMLAALAGAFVAFGAGLFSMTMTGATTAGFGLFRLIGGVAFSVGLILVVVAGAELFTGNTLIVIAFISGKVRFRQLMRNWAIVYVGNLVGSLCMVLLVYATEQWQMSDGGVGVTAYNIAGKKLSLSFSTAFASGILCNSLVCLAVWLCYSARSTTDKILSILFPIAAFVALGYEHSVANMYFIPYGMALSHTDSFMASAAALKFDPSVFTMQNFLLGNLLPVTLGNIVGGSFLVGVVYWIIYLRHVRTPLQHGKTESPAAETADSLH